MQRTQLGRSSGHMSVGALAAMGILPFSIEVVQGHGAPVPVPRSVQRFVQGASPLYLPEAGHQLVAADLDRDGDEDRTQIQIMPLQAYEGKSAAAAGGSADFSIEPVRPCVLLALKFITVVTSGTIDDLFMTAFEAGDVNLFPYKGAAPLGGFFSKDSTEGAIESPLFGPGVPLTFTIRNKQASNAATIWGVAKVASIIG